MVRGGRLSEGPPEEDLSFSGSGLQNDTLLRADRLLSDFSVDLADFPPTNVNVAY